MLRLESGAVGTIECHNAMNLSIWNEAGKGVGQFEGWGTNACTAPTLEETLRITYEHAINEGKIKSPLTVFATSELPLKVEYREGEVCTEESKKIAECESPSQREKLENLVSGLRRRATSFPWKTSLARTVSVETEEEIIEDKIGAPISTGTCFPTETIKENGEEITVPASWEKVPAGCVKINVVCPQIPAEVVFYGQLNPELINGVKNGLSPSRMKFIAAESGDLIASEGEAPQTKTAGEIKFMGMNGEELLTAK